MKLTFEQGWGARPFKEQFPQLSTATAQRLDDINAAITLLYVRDLITESMMLSARNKKFPKVVAAALREPHVPAAPKKPLTYDDSFKDGMVAD